MATKGSNQKKLLDFEKMWFRFEWDRVVLSNRKKYWEIPDLLDLQKKGFSEFVNYYLPRLFEEVSPITDLTWEQLQITIEDVKVWEPLYSVEECKIKELTYWGIISWKIKLLDLENNKTLFSKRANIGTLPLMTSQASYIINGVERVMISQLIRSYWIFYWKKDFKYSFKVIPERWSWLEVVIEKSWNIVVRINKSRKFSLVALLRVFGFETDESIIELFKDVFEEEDMNFIQIALKRDSTTDALSAAEHIYSKLRPWELIDAESALDYIKAQFLDPNRLYLGRIARRKINAKLWIDKSLDDDSSNLFDSVDLVAALKYLFKLANEHPGYYFDDPDHLSNKRIRLMWEILYSHLQPVMKRFVKSVKGKLSILDLEQQIKLTDIVNFKIIDNSIKSFFATSQLSQFLDQINPLAELEHKRRLTALWPWWLKRETAKFDVRDLHPSHYWRICPIETPEWQNIWLVLYQSLYSRINNEWFLEVPVFKVFNEIEPKAELLVNRISRRDIYELDSKWKPTKKIIVKEDSYIDEKAAKKIEKMYGKYWTKIKVKAFFTEDIVYISPEMDEKCVIADMMIQLDEYNNILADRVPWRHFNEMKVFHPTDITHIDINPAQLFSANTSLIPFVDHNDWVRASVATNQHRQAVPLVKNEAPLIWTWLEKDIISMTHAVIEAEDDWEVIYVDGKRVKVKYKKLWTKEYKLTVFKKSNQKTILHQVPRVSLKQKVKKWDVLAEWPCSDNWELAVWKNLRIAFLPWEWYNYEDAIVISSRLVSDDELTSIHITEHEIEVCDTKLGPEETTNDIPWVSLTKLSNLWEDGIIRIWSVVKWWDILVWKITPKWDWDLTPEERLIQAIFGDRSKSVKDTSLYLPSWVWWKVVDVVVLDAKKWDNLMAWIRKKIKVYVATTRKIEVWDKLAARHGNKWIISVVVPQEDMPYTEDWQPIDICLNPLWVISRMNLWQVFETQLGLIAKTLWVKFSVPTFAGVSWKQMKDMAVKCWLNESLKMNLYDWRTWEKYERPVTVWYMYMLKLSHMVEDKIHARSVWPYSLITQQPLWWKARDGWQRFWEMEVWALEAYSAVYTLQEMLTVKSDNVIWRNKMYEALIKWKKVKIWWLPESFHYLVYLLKWLCQDIVPLSKEEMEKEHHQRINKILELWLSWLTGYTDEMDDREDEKEKEEIMQNVLDELESDEEIE